MSDQPVDPTRELLEEYALGMLDRARQTQFEARLAEDPALQRELAATLETLTTLAFSTPAEPSPALKSRVLERIANVTEHQGTKPETKAVPLAPRTRASRATVWLGAALAASLLALIKISLDLRGAREDTRVAQSFADARSQTLAQRDSLIAQLTDPASELVTLAATGTARPVIRAYVNRARRTMMVSAASLEALPAGRVYQLWFMVGTTPVPSVTFTGDSLGRAFIQNLTIPAGVGATAITLEPQGGSPAPTTPVLFLGKLASE